MKKNKKLISIVTLFTLLALGTGIPAEAKTFSDFGPWGKTGLVTASVVSSVIYSPLKLVYATLGSVTSGLVLGFTAGEATSSASKIAKQSVTGDWYVGPDVFLGSEYLDFVGPDDK